MRFHSFVISTLLGLALIPTSEVAAQTTARVAAWNLLGFHPIPPRRIPALSRGIAAIDADLIAVVEVNPIETMDRLVTALARQGHEYSYKIIAQQARQKIGILYRPHVLVADVQLIPHSDQDNAENRKAFFCRVKINEFDFFLIAVHLKSSRAEADRRTRTAQARAIAAFLRRHTRNGEEKDVLIVGDYNMIPPFDGEENDEVNFEALSAGGFVHFISSEDLAGQASHINTDGELNNLLDGYGIADEHTTEYQPGTLEILPLYDDFEMSPLEFSQQVSDHVPLVARFNSSQDDDEDQFDWRTSAAWSQMPSILPDLTAPARPVVTCRQTCSERRPCRARLFRCSRILRSCCR